MEYKIFKTNYLTTHLCYFFVYLVFLPPSTFYLFDCLILSARDKSALMGVREGEGVGGSLRGVENLNRAFIFLSKFSYHF